jgi:cobalt-zinc-cadmium efflux system membrane fusion protein
MTVRDGVTVFTRAFGALPWRGRLALAAGMVVLIAVVALRGLGGGAPPDGTEAAAATPGTFRATDAQWAGLTMVPVGTVTFRSVTETDGNIATDDDTTTPVFSPYSGRVTKVFASAGDMVKKGQPLCAVEASEFVQGQNDLVAAVSALATARAQLTLDESAERRQHQLYDAKGAALKDWQQAQVDLATAQGAFRTAETVLAASRNRLKILGKSDQDIAALERSPDVRTMTPEAVVAAPIGGTVVQRQVGIGQYITSASSGASTPVFAIGDLSTVWLVANVREADAPFVHVGEPVEVSVLAYPGRLFTAKVTYVAPSIDPVTRRLPVRAEVDNADGALKPQMFAHFRIVTGDESTAAAVPEAAVIHEGDSARVWVAGADKSLGLRQIQVGRDRDGMAEVLSGVSPGETVVTSGALFIDRAAKGD